VDPVPDPLLLRQSSIDGIEPGPLDLQPGTLTTRPKSVHINLSIIYQQSQLRVFIDV
jgi:hypothetical protein